MNINKIEKIVSPAVEFETDMGKEVIMCLSYDNDIRVENMKFHFADLGFNEDENYNEVLGFITSEGRFVLPGEALIITGMQNQLKFKDRKYLLPGDLY